MFSSTKAWVGQFLKNGHFQGLNLKTHLEIGENKRFEAFMKVEIKTPLQLTPVDFEQILGAKITQFYPELDAPMLTFFAMISIKENNDFCAFTI